MEEYIQELENRIKLLEEELELKKTNVTPLKKNENSTLTQYIWNSIFK